jgi:hypothetical protein
MCIDVSGVLAWIKLYPFRTWMAFALAVVLSLIIGIVRYTGGQPARPVRVDPVPTPTTSAETVTGQVTAAGLTLNYPGGGASLSVPAGALPVGTVVAITKGTAATLRQLGALQPDGVSWDVAASVEPPSLPVTLVLPYDPAKVQAGTRPLVTTYDELSGWWVPVKTNAVPETGKLLAELPGFSLKTWILDRVPDPGKAGPGTESWLEYQGQALLPRRPDRPQCSGRKAPPWVRQVEVEAGVPACVRGDGEGFTIEAANQHGYPVTLDLDTPFTRASTSPLDDTMDGLLNRLPGGVLVLPTGRSAIAYDPPPAPVGTVQARFRRDGDTMVQWLVFEAVNGVPGARASFGPAAVACARQALPGAAPAYQRVSTLLDCLAAALERLLRADRFDVAKDLWRTDGILRPPAGVRQMVGVLRWVRGLQAGNFAQLAGEVTAGDGQGGADRVAVRARWAGAPRWARPASVKPLFDLAPAAGPPGAVGPSGQHLSSRLAGRSYPDSTGAWVACAGPPATLRYHLGGKFRRFTAVVGLSEAAPADLAVEFQVTVDGRAVATSVVDRKKTATVDVAVPGGTTLAISAVRTAGGCPPSPLPFGILGDASLFS